MIYIPRAVIAGVAHNRVVLRSQLSGDPAPLGYAVKDYADGWIFARTRVEIMREFRENDDRNLYYVFPLIGPATPRVGHVTIGVNAYGQTALLVEEGDDYLVQMNDRDHPHALGWWRYPKTSFRRM